MRVARTRLLVGLAVAGALTAACGQPGAEPTADEPSSSETVVRVGAFNFPESQLLAELYGQAVAATGLEVAPVSELGSRETAQPALEQGRIDMLVEYAGSALNFVERRPDVAGASVERTHARLTAAFAERGITVAAPAPAQNQNAFAVRRDTAREFGLRSLRDLRGVGDELVAGGPPECPNRSTCLAGLRDVYGVEFARFLSIDTPAHVAAALREEEIDVGLLFTTDPSIEDSDFVVLIDDRELQPAENIVPVVRSAVVETHGQQLVAALDEVSAQLTTQELAGLNRQVEAGAGDAGAVARRWLAERGITP